MRTVIPCMAVLLALAGGWSATTTWGAEHPEHPTKTAAKDVGLLDGRTYTGQIGTIGEETGDPDDLVFKAGQFRSTACEAHGFGAASYAATEKGEKIQFTARMKNDKGETLSWKGVVRGKRIRGTAKRQTAEGTTEFWFKGALKAAGSDKKSEHPEHPKSGKKPEHPEHPK